MRPSRVAAVLAALLLLPVATAQAATPTLRAGAGQADVTPPRTGYFLGGWTRADRLARGQSTRLFANAIALQRGDRKVALVAVELFAVPAGLQQDVARALADLGYDRSSVLLSASHTHSGPGGYANNPTYNTAAPSPETALDPLSFVRLIDPSPADRQLYTFLVAQITDAVRQADRDLAPAAAGWGSGTILGLTENRSLDAHLRNHGITVRDGTGTAEQDPGGYEHTIDPSVDVLRVDKLVRRRGKTRRRPIGAWLNFADHGTVVHSETQAYSGDHHASAWRTFAARVRKAGKVPRSQRVVGVYPNSAEGDQTAGIRNVGPAAADRVGRVEAAEMFRAWRGAKLSRRPALDLRWTSACFCGQDTATGKVATSGKVGVGFLTGSEEGRGPLFEITGRDFEGDTSPLADPEQGNKVVVPVGDPPPAVPLTVMRIGDRALASVPGEATKEVGVRMRAAVMQALSPAGVKRVVIAGLSNEFIQYITTPEEYGAQNYEGASSLYGPNEGTFLAEQLGGLAAALASGQAAPAPYESDESYGVAPDGPAFGTGADAGTIVQQPGSAVERLSRVTLAWTGGADGVDRPVGTAFVSAQRRVRGRWRTVASDLGMQFLWTVDGSRYDAAWEVPLSAPEGRYRLVVTASNYRLESTPFRVNATTRLQARAAGDAITLHYPEAVVDQDLTARPAIVRGARVVFTGADGRRDTIGVSRQFDRIPIPKGLARPITVAGAAATDRYGNATGGPLTLP